MVNHRRCKYNLLRCLMLCLCIALNLEVRTFAANSLNRNMFMLSNLNTDQGLSSARVYSILQTEDGAMWISTKRGVDRYNGQLVKNYQLATDKPYSDASGGKNIKLLKGIQQQIYAYDNKGKLYIYNKVEDSFGLIHDLRHVLGESVMLNEVIIDRQGNFWIAMDKGIYMISSTEPTDMGRYILKNTYVNHIAFVGKDLLVGSSDGLYTYSLAKRKLSKRIADCSVLSSYHDVAAHQIWLGTFHKGIKVLDDRTWRLLPAVASLQELPLIPVRSIIPYDSQTVLLGIDGAGVYAYDKLTKHSYVLLNTDGRPENVLQGNGVYALCLDRLGDLWVGSYSGGVDLAIPMEHTLEFVRHEYLNSQSLIDNRVNDVFLDRSGKIWYATDKGVSVYDEATHLWHHALYNKVALSINQTQNGRILVATYGQGVYEVHADGSAVSVYSSANGILKTDYVYSLLADSDGSLWIGCLDGDMVCISSKGIKYLPINEVQCITESPDKKYIDVGTSRSCFRVDKRTYRITRFYCPEEYPNTDYNFFVNSMAYQDAQHIWIATDGGGLCLYDMNKHRFKVYTTQQSLPSNNVYALLRMPNGSIWMSTDKGLALMNHGRVMNVNFFKGLEGEYKRMAVARTPDGRIVFGSSNGAVILASRFANGLHYTAPLRIMGIEVEGVEPTADWSRELFGMLQDGKMRFSHSENTLVISFESINYQYQHDIEYQYYLEGFDHRWSEPSSDQQVRFANLPPGNYTFHVKAIGRSNGRVLGESSLRIHIAQPWWNSWWAWIVYLCLLSTIAYFGWDYYKERLHRKYYDEKINFFVNTAHNIRTPLSLVLAPLADLAKDTTLAEKSRNFLEMAQRNGDKLLRMVTELLDFQKIDQAKAQVHLKEVEASVLLRQQVDKFKMSAQEKHIRLTLGECPQQMFLTDLKMMDLIFENLLSNAVKYTPEDGNVMVACTVDEAEKMLRIRVSDSGIGIPKAEMKHIFQSFFRASNAVNSQEMGSGLGLMLTRQLVQKLGGKLSFESEEGKGTTFTLSLPLDKTTPSASKNASVSSDRIGQNPSVSKEDSVTSVSSDENKTSSDDNKYSEEHLPAETNSDDHQQDTILFVDDNADLRLYIRMAFGNTYHVVDVENGEEALRYLKENGECDIVVSDVMMPGMQGDELCRRIKENKETSWLPVILLTAKAGRDFMIEGLGLGADDYIAKPFDSAILASKIDSMLKNRRRLSQYYMERSLALVRGGETSRKESASEVSVIESTGVASASSDRIGQNPSDGKNVSALSASSDENKTLSDEKETTSVELDPENQAFVEKTTRLVMTNLSDTDFNIDRLCREMAMSRTLFYGKLKTLTGQTPQDFIRLIRLEQAAMYIEQGDSVMDVSVKAGFVNVKYFSTVFKKHFGVSPSKYTAQN